MRHFERGFGTKIKFAGHIRISLKKLRTAVEQLVAGNNTMPCRHRTIKITEWFQPFFFTNPLSIFEEIILCIYITYRLIISSNKMKAEQWWLFRVLRVCRALRLDFKEIRAFSRWYLFRVLRELESVLNSVVISQKESYRILHLWYKIKYRGR